MRGNTDLTMVLPLVAILHPAFAAAQDNVTTPPVRNDGIGNQSRGADGVAEAKAVIEGRTFGKWREICVPAQACRLSQSIVGSNTNRPLLIARAYQSSADPIVVLTFPLGIHLAFGIAVAFDAAKPDKLAFETCDPDGCHVSIRLTAKAVAHLRKARKLNVTVQDSANKVVTLPLELDGLDAGLKELKE